MQHALLISCTADHRGRERQGERHNLMPEKRQPDTWTNVGLCSPHGRIFTPFLTAEQQILSAKFSEMLKGNKQEEKKLA